MNPVARRIEPQRAHNECSKQEVLDQFENLHFSILVYFLCALCGSTAVNRSSRQRPLNSVQFPSDRWPTMSTNISRTSFAVLFFVASVAAVAAQPARGELTLNPLIRIIRFEDQRNWNEELNQLLSNANPAIRKRAALAAGRIGDERAVPPLAEMLLTDRDKDVRQMAAFALGEIESMGGAFALTEVLKPQGADIADANIRARAVEALGKIAAAAAATGSPP